MRSQTILLYRGLLGLSAWLTVALPLEGDTPPAEKKPPAQASSQVGEWTPSQSAIDKILRWRPGLIVEESQVPHYTLPAIAATPSGRKTTLQQFEKYVYGTRPTVPLQLSVEVTEKTAELFDATVIGEQLSFTIGLNGAEYQFPAVLYRPNRSVSSDDRTPTSEKLPVIVLANNRWQSSLTSIQDESLDEEDRRMRRGFLPVQTFARRGYAVISIYNSDVDPDDKNRTGEGIRGFVKQNAEDDTATWGAISAWGWAASRVADYLQTREEFDSERIVVAGHSRGGKTALWAAATDPRFAIAYSNQSGCGGAALSRRCYGERIQHITKTFPHWFCGTLSDYRDRESELPVDQHQLLGLIAPRGVFVNCATNDLWSDPRGQYLALVASAAAFHNFEVESITDPTIPAIGEVRRSGPTGYVIRAGDHNLLMDDWKRFLDFADEVLTR